MLHYYELCSLNTAVELLAESESTERPKQTLSKGSILLSYVFALFT